VQVATKVAAQQLDGADPASCGESNSRYYRSAGRAAHLEAVMPPRLYRAHPEEFE